MEYGIGSAESQYFDVLERQGFVGLSLYILILIAGIKYSLKLARKVRDKKEGYFWFGCAAWQLAVGIHGLTVETTRFPLYNLFFYIYLGMLSHECFTHTRSKLTADLNVEVRGSTF
jgi:O-antigen ligase